MSKAQNGRVAIAPARRPAARLRQHRRTTDIDASSRSSKRRGIHAEPAVYADDMLDEVRQQLMAVDGVLVWVNPLEDVRTREKLDAPLRDVAAAEPWVSAHPDVILKMGVKEVLHRTRHLGWGMDTHLYRTAEEFRAISSAYAPLRADHVCSSRTAATPVKASGRWNEHALAECHFCRDGPRGTPRQHARNVAFRNFHDALREGYLLGRLNYRSTVSGTAA